MRWLSFGGSLANSSYSIQGLLLIVMLNRQLPEKFHYGVSTGRIERVPG